MEERLHWWNMVAWKHQTVVELSRIEETSFPITAATLEEEMVFASYQTLPQNAGPHLTELGRKRMYVWLVPGLFRSNPARSYVDFQIPRIHTVKKHSHQHKASDNKTIRLKFCWLPFLRWTRLSYFITCKNHVLVKSQLLNFVTKTVAANIAQLSLSDYHVPTAQNKKSRVPLLLLSDTPDTAARESKSSQIFRGPSWKTELNFI